VLAKPPNRSTPDHCAGDGTYAQAVDCYRQTSTLDFTIEEAKGLRAEGGMRRDTPGAERLRFTLKGAGGGDGEWTAEAKSTGVVWTHGGRRETSEPAIADRVWQRTTMYVDPQKKEGEPQRAGNEKAGGQDCIRYHFTDANSGDAHDVWVSTTDGHIVQMNVESHGVFPGYAMKIVKAGK
jgi:hypothetical protein